MVSSSAVFSKSARTSRSAFDKSRAISLSSKPVCRAESLIVDTLGDDIRFLYGMVSHHEVNTVFKLTEPLC